MTPFNPFAREKDQIEPEPPTLSQPRKERPTTPKDASSSGMQLIPRLRARATSTKTKELVKGVNKLFKTKQALSAVDDDVHRSFDNNVGAVMLPGAEQNTEIVWILPMDEEWIKTLRTTPYYQKAIHSEKHDHVTPFLHAAQTLCDYHANVFVYEREVLSIRNMVWKVVSVMQMLHSGMLDDKDAVKEVGRHKEKM